MEAQRESPFFVKDTERAIAALEARLRTLLPNPDEAWPHDAIGEPILPSGAE